MYHRCEARQRTDSWVIYGNDEDAIVDARQIQESDLDSNSDSGIEDDKSAGGQAGETDEEEQEFNEDEGEQVRIESSSPAGKHVFLDPDWSMAVKPTASHVTCLDIIKSYGASDFEFRTNEWLDASIASGSLPRLQPVTRWHRFDVWHKFYLHHRPLCFDPDLPRRRDTIRTQPPALVRANSSHPPGPGSFDTVLFLMKTNEFGIHKYRAGRVRVIFKLPAHLRNYYPHPLVYLELFTPFPKSLIESHRMHTTSHDMHHGICRTAVVPLVWVVAACHLVWASHFVVDQWCAVQEATDAAKAAERQATEAERTKAAWAKAARMRLLRAQTNVAHS
ncbi:hypothetical protein CTheo_9035 [Ceratobasidium theobromae]|uniref:Uncharacterized protein n=1 Tax=Ceratobasidium theobromae TaxID=1582974 RepID=A0A5N5Q7Z0_9AGAM|nr:hypothetical protein CTheo_9035 [Ceratobasidium theobromae]